MDVSVVIPAYNEEEVIEDTVGKIRHYFQEVGQTVEIIVSDDGSTDATRDRVQALAESLPQVRLLANPHKGKGHAVYQGVMSSQGNKVLLCDADLATPIEEFEKLQKKTNDGYEVAIASREGLSAHRMDEPFYRHLMGRVFNLLVQMLALKGINDTQCGFKLLSQKAAKDIFSRMRLYGPNSPILNVPAVTAYDVEMLYLALKLGYKIAEVSTDWHYKATVRISPLRDSWRNLKDLLQVRLNDWRGFYS